VKIQEHREDGEDKRIISIMKVTSTRAEDMNNPKAISWIKRSIIWKKIKESIISEARVKVILNVQKAWEKCKQSGIEYWNKSVAESMKCKCEDIKEKKGYNTRSKYKSRDKRKKTAALNCIATQHLILRSLLFMVFKPLVFIGCYDPMTFHANSHFP